MKRKCLSKRFWDKVLIQDPSACWHWIGSTNKKGGGGYGVLAFDGSYTLAHRTSAVLHGLVDYLHPGQFVLHRCDNRPCVNPAHLFIGSMSDNSKDREAKKRGGRKARGVDAGNARLNEKSVLYIRKNPKRLTQQRLADKFGVSQATIYRVLFRVCWRHV